jgi:hypothetical protein
MDIRALRAAITGLAGFAAVQEQALICGAAEAESGDPACWAAVPLIAHNTEFRHQQVLRLRAIRARQVPPEFPEADHQSASLYAALSAQPADAVARESWRVSGELIEEVRLAGADDLLDPARHPWLRGRPLWLQIIVRGFWHPAGHLGEYYGHHGQSGRAVTVAERWTRPPPPAAWPAITWRVPARALACSRRRRKPWPRRSSSIRTCGLTRPAIPILRRYVTRTC